MKNIFVSVLLNVPLVPSIRNLTVGNISFNENEAVVVTHIDKNLKEALDHGVVRIYTPPPSEDDGSEEAAIEIDSVFIEGLFIERVPAREVIRFSTLPTKKSEEEHEPTIDVVNPLAENVEPPVITPENASEAVLNETDAAPKNVAPEDVILSPETTSPTDTTQADANASEGSSEKADSDEDAADSSSDENASEEPEENEEGLEKPESDSEEQSSEEDDEETKEIKRLLAEDEADQSSNN